MSMKPEEEEFQQLRRLLALKRHEQPPPGYFNDFSRQVITQIIASRPFQDSSTVELLGWEAPWLQRLWTAFETKPWLAGAFGVAVCGLLISGIVYSEKPAPSTTVSVPLVTQPGTEPLVLAGAAPIVRSPLGQPSGLAVSSTEGVATPQNRLSLFQEVNDSPKPWLATPVNFSPGN